VGWMTEFHLALVRCATSDTRQLRTGSACAYNDVPRG
jgi:hypothetical protein